MKLRRHHFSQRNVSDGTFERDNSNTNMQITCFTNIVFLCKQLILLRGDCKLNFTHKKMADTKAERHHDLYDKPLNQIYARVVF